MIGKDIYDVCMDEIRSATQADVDRYSQWLQTLGLVVVALRQIAPDLVPPSGPNFDERLRNKIKTFLNGKKH